MSYSRQSNFATNDSAGFGHGFNASQGQEEDLAVYNWGDAGNLLDGDDDELNDETFGGGMEDISASLQILAPSHSLIRACC